MWRALSRVVFQRNSPLVFAHRGGCALGPENTCAAFQAGLAAGADGLELDVHLSADGIPVVIHDPTLDRTTDASGPVARRTAAELAGVDAAYRFAAEGAFPFRGQGEGVPTLRDVLRRFRDVPLIVEMKVDSPEMGAAVARDVRSAGAVERVCAAGAGTRSTAAAREALPEMASSASKPEVRFACYRSWARWPVHRVAYGGYQVPNGRIITESSRDGSFDTRTKRDSACKCGRSTSRKTWFGCSDGASTV